MTTSNINKIMRSNLHLKPWILSKNTTEIVNTCIEKIYKQNKNNFRNELVQAPRTITAKPENRAPVRSLKTLERARPPVGLNMSSRNKNRITNISDGARLLNAIMINSKRNAPNSLASNKRFLKSPNYKIYGTRRFGSSASSSKTSIFRRYDERRRTRTHNGNLNYILRGFGTANAGTTGNNYGLNPGVAKYILAARNQQMETRLGSVPQAIQVSSNIQSDLMSVDDCIKDRIALGRGKLPKYMKEKQRDNVDPLEGWHHPPAHELFLTRANERGIAKAELQEQYRRLKIETRAKQFENLRQLEKRSSIGAGSVGHQAHRSAISDAYVLTAKEQTPRAEKPLALRVLEATEAKMANEQINVQVNTSIPKTSKEPIKSRDLPTGSMKPKTTTVSTKTIAKISATPTSTVLGNKSLTTSPASRFNHTSYLNGVKKY